MSQMGAPPPAPRRMVPPFSPVLLLGLAMTPVSPTLLQPAFDAVLRVLRRRHPDILERMEDYADALVCIDPIDLPFVILLSPDPLDPRLSVRRDAEGMAPTATIRGPLEMLVALAEGKVDGDALFFTRQLVIEGDTEVVVALRNAVDGAGIDLVGDIASALGPFGRPLRAVLGHAARLGGALHRNMETLRSALIAPAVRDADAQAARIASLEAEVKALRRASKKGRSSS